MAKCSSKLTASAKAIDPTLNALFASSSGPVTAPPKSRYSEAPPSKAKPQTADSDEELLNVDQEDDEELSELDSAERSDDDDEAESDSESESSEQEDDESSAEEEIVPEPTAKLKARKRKREEDDIEAKYLSKLLKAEEKEQPVEKRSKKNKKEEEASEESEDEIFEKEKEEESEEEEEEEGDDDDEKEQADEDEDEHSDIPVHESLTTDKTKDKNSGIEKANRTVFLSNVASDAVSNKAAKRTLVAHLASVLDKDAKPPQKIESVRFRSVAFSGGGLPKRAAYITKSLMQETTKSANAYVVFSTPAAARNVVAELNGTVVLDRHLRVDSVAHPGATDHRRCIFVGNLGFVDDETVLATDEDGKTVQKKRNKVPSDLEEGLWRTFGKHAGKVENVRVVRDPKTRVGKGFAYVQFYDANHVEAALLLDGKKYPPMLPRALRVTRAKAPHKTAVAMERSSKVRAQAGAGASGNTKYKTKITPEQQSMAGRASRLLGRSGALRERKASDKKPRQANGSGVVPKDDIKTPEDFIFEGRRASAKDGKPKDLKFGKRNKIKVGVKKSKPTGRSARRAQEWRKKDKSS